MTTPLRNAKNCLPIERKRTHNYKMFLLIREEKRREKIQNQNRFLRKEIIKLLFEFNRGRNPMFNSGYIGVLSIYFN